MRTNHKPPVKREPVSLTPCRGCGEPITQANTTWDAERQTFVHSCNTTDPANTTLSPMIICVLYVCQCGDLGSDHDGPDGACMGLTGIIDIDGGMLMCDCTRFTVADPAPQP